MDLLASLEEQGNSTPVMVMTAWSSFDLAVEAMRRGACDFIQKPWDNDRLLAAIRKQAESERRKRSELEIAANVQQKLFPRKLRLMRTVDYAGQCLARARGRAAITTTSSKSPTTRSASFWRMFPAKASPPRS